MEPFLYAAVAFATMITEASTASIISSSSHQNATIGALSDARTATSQHHASKALSPGAVAGVVIGLLVLLLSIAVVFAFFIMRRKRRTSTSNGPLRSFAEKGLFPNHPPQETSGVLTDLHNKSLPPVKKDETLVTNSSKASSADVADNYSKPSIVEASKAGHVPQSLVYKTPDEGSWSSDTGHVRLPTVRVVPATPEIGAAL